MPPATTAAEARLAQNNLQVLAASGRICTALGIKICRGIEIVHIAKAAGYDSLFIDLEHTCMTVSDASQLCITAISAGITPFVRVPHQCGSGLIQRVLDVGAMGVVAPHINGIEDAKEVISVSKYPPFGTRSLSGGFPHFEYASPSPGFLMEQMNRSGSQCFIMIETVKALEAVDDIAALPGCDVLLVGSQDLATAIGTLPDWDDPRFWNALEAVGNAAKKHGKLMGIAGLYHRPDILEKVIKELGARWIVGGHDVGLLLTGGRANSDLLKRLQSQVAGR
ncbi:2,4-dihydroxyhept-2-ene-1,7-dioic acid aldolase-like protein [Aspergillus sclerotioniger CBS 115572]|uniref:2,4-dihydroxyhept-2-ene-1,7-dioic acid aldolase-like protein n=1 Tax=Aspergillus sclerotioniger CBS 115572 TaxID=1450535 RepID=A0A317UUD0_9EURO|nr:2,4-dihydroxyhept-2-ene-1,7-dioic acid aldolase-like protein [Aspergillus sclerotioniger CBS 115572]PWY64979.1 2,4-dihydroxyhept-2-ene-1,7-dioic acid aldolase-like protein [Aspergillus sclerotioniger CBS 115572]